ncbi:MAG: sigma-54-dependent Fis family transcriptional regulator [Gemmatimonadetes bacterium]|nr:sigma-54-dependent Fis family transcriptional regulator [Gemmatimonadota bacterium]
MRKRHEILVCGERRAEITTRLREILPEGTTPSVLSVADGADLCARTPAPEPDLILASSDRARDRSFLDWLRDHDRDHTIVWIRASDSPDEAPLEGALVLPEQELHAVPYLLKLARRRTRDNVGVAGAYTPRRRIVGRSEGILEVQTYARKVCNAQSSVLVTGESGTGKELIASLIHYESDRRNEPFVKVNCAAIPETLLEAELFGIEKNIATNVDRRIGKFEQAQRGTIFLDEIGDMSLMTQAKVLRVLQEREFERVGGTESIHIRTRVIAATNKDLRAEMKRSAFRSDLFYRLNVINLQIPALRDRREDIPALTEYFIGVFCEENGVKPRTVSPETMEVLIDYEWPGNVRELENAIERAVVLGDGDTISTEDLPPAILGAVQQDAEGVDARTFQSRVSDFERSLLIDALNRSDWVQAHAARRLGISERSMWHFYKKYRLDRFVKNRRPGRKRGRSARAL